MKLDINENNLILDIPKRYYLDMKLSYPVFPEKGNAKYDSKTKKLKINLVVDQSKIIEKIEETPKMIEEIPEKTIKNEKKEETKEELENLIEIKPKTQEEEDININNENENEEQHDDNLLEFHEQNHYLKMKESPKKTPNVINDNDIEEKKVLVEEIQDQEIKDSTTDKKEKTQIIESKIKIPTKLQFKTQETAQKYFLILHIPKYSKSDCQIRKLSQEVTLDKFNRIKFFRFFFVAKMKKR